MRKEIINLIQDYMDKTLGFGCLIIHEEEKPGVDTPNGQSFDDVFVFGRMSGDETYDCFGYIDKHEICTDWEKSEYDFNITYFRDDEEWALDFIKAEKIIGHYDLSAVLKYIEDNLDKGELSLYFTKEAKEIVFWKLDRIKMGYIPNKPLHLYTEQEEKDLLELLKKLGKNKI